MENFVVNYIIDNKEWIFSGVGVAIISWLFFGRSSNSSMNQKSGDNSTNIQVGSDFNINKKEKSSEDQ